MTRQEEIEFDRENRELNWLKPGLFKDLTEKPEPETEIPDDYREPKAVRLAKIAGAGALAANIAANIPAIVKNGYENVLVYAGLTLAVALVGCLLRK